MDLETLKSLVEESLDEFRGIRSINEIGDCEEVMNDVISFLGSKGINSRRLCIYNSNSDLGYVSDYIGRNELGYISIPERGSSYSEYVIHFVPYIDGCVIDVNAPDKISCADDIVFELPTYKSIIYGLNKNLDINRIIFKVL